MERAPAGWNTERAASVRVADSGPRGFDYAPSRTVSVPARETRGPETVRDAAPRVETEAERPQAGSQPSGPEAPSVPAPPDKPFTPAIPMEQAALVLPEERLTETGRAAPWRIAGEVLKTYIVCEDEEQNVWLIDKHAAHERVNFDRLMAADQPPMRQTLLRPAAAELAREDCALLLENSALLESLGFSCEDFGDGALLVREVPADLDAEDISATLEELADALRTGRSPTEKRQNLLHTIACKSAIKAGWDSGEQELRALVDKVQSGEVRYCPHGRPVKVKLSKYELEKMFKRA